MHHLLYPYLEAAAVVTAKQTGYNYVEDMTWPCGDTKFLFSIFQHKKRNFVSPSNNVMICLLYQYHSEIVSTLTKVPLRKA